MGGRKNRIPVDGVIQLRVHPEIKQIKFPIRGGKPGNFPSTIGLKRVVSQHPGELLLIPSGLFAIEKGIAALGETSHFLIVEPIEL